MPRGRPKGSKNKVNQEVILFEESKQDEEKSPTTTFNVFTPTEKEVVDEPKIIGKPKLVDQEELKEKLKARQTLCEVCGKPVYCQRVSFRLSALTGCAAYRRSLKTDWLQVCDECEQELNKLVEDWVLKKNPELSRYYGYKKSDE